MISYREHRRRAKAHFISRWKQRINDNPPDINTLCAEFRNTMSGKGNGILTLINTPHIDTSRWSAKTNGVDVIITYNHRLKLPISVWVTK